jgi:ATP-dependent Clp protease ATP-binding subunit ClpX
MDGVELEFTEEARHWIANEAIKKNTGARGLRNIIEGLLQDLQFNLPELAAEGLTKVIVTPTVDDKLVLLFRNTSTVNK